MTETQINLHDTDGTGVQPHEIIRLPSEVGLKELSAQTVASLMLDPPAFEHMQRVASLYAHSDMVPAQFQGNVANCAIALELAYRLGVSVYMLMQSSYIVAGRPGLEAKLAIALCNQRGPFRGPIQYEYERDDAGAVLACTAFATHKNGVRAEATITAQMVKAEGWADKRGSKWLSIPEQMYAYRSAVFLIRRVCPEVIMGMHTVDELEDTYGGTKYVEGTATPTAPKADAPKRGGGREGLRGALHGGSDGASKEPKHKGADANEDGGTDAPPPPPPERGGRSNG
jgi:hypothetical protein